MTAVTVFSNTDDGAPQIVDRKPSEILAVLQACLVDGYGTKTALGWTKAFENVGAVQAVFRNSTADGGSGGYFKFQLGSTDTSHAPCSITSAMSMTDIDTFVLPGYRTFIAASSTHWTNWMLLGTTHAFYLILGDANNLTLGARRQMLENQMFVGDFIPHIPNDQAKFIAVGTYIANGANVNSINYNVCFASWWKNRVNRPVTAGLRTYGVDGDSTPVDGGIYTPDGAWNEYDRAQAAHTQQGVYVKTYVGVFNVSPGANNKDPNGDFNTNSRVYPALRGNLPGLLTEVYSSVDNYSADTYPAYRDVNGQAHLLLRQPTVSFDIRLNTVEW